MTPDELGRLQGLVEDFIRTKTKKELMEATVAHKLLLVPHSTVATLSESPQLASA